MKEAWRYVIRITLIYEKLNSYIISEMLESCPDCSLCSLLKCQICCACYGSSLKGKIDRHRQIDG